MKRILLVFTSFVFCFSAFSKEAPKEDKKSYEKAIFAGGCFWCMEPPFEKLKGVIEAQSGYSGGRTDKPTYEQVSHSDTGHKEVVEITFDPKLITYAELLEVFWKNIDPLDEKGQFCDKGDSYKSALFYSSEEQKKAAEASLEKLSKSGILKQKIVTEVLPAKTFFPAEDYHQDYYKKNPLRYRYYRNGCGRDKRLKELWGKSP